MFGFGKKTKKPARARVPVPVPVPAPADPSAQPPADRQALIRSAMQTARSARAEIGEDTIRQIVEAMNRKENSPFQEARRKIMALDQDRVADNIRAFMEEKK